MRGYRTYDYIVVSAIIGNIIEKKGFGISEPPIFSIGYGVFLSGIMR